MDLTSTLVETALAAIAALGALVLAGAAAAPQPVPVRVRGQRRR